MIEETEFVFDRNGVKSPTWVHAEADGADFWFKMRSKEGDQLAVLTPTGRCTLKSMDDASPPPIDGAATLGVHRHVLCAYDMPISESARITRDKKTLS